MPEPLPTIAYASPATVSIPSAPASDWSPLRNPVFRAMWIASAISYTGFEIRNFAAPLLMVDYQKVYGVSQAMAPFTVTASTLPIPLFVLFAGALADVLDRRKLLIVTHFAMMVAAALLGILTICHLMPPGLMLAFLFAIGAGYAMMNPTLLSVLPELVSPAEIRSALALNGLNMNIARVAGPAIGGAIVASVGYSHFYAGKGIAFLATGASLAGVIWVVYNWQPPERKKPAHPETVLSAVRTGLRYTYLAPSLLAILARVFIFIVCAGIAPTLAATMCKKEPAALHADLGAMLWMICFGLGAVAGVHQMQKLQRRFGIETLVTVCTVGFGVAMLIVAHTPNLWLGFLGMALAGFSWVIVPTNFNTSTQLAVPTWIKGRAMGMYVLVLWGAFAVGSAVFGGISKSHGYRSALNVAAIGVLLGVIPILWLRLVPKRKEDFAPAKQPALDLANAQALSGSMIRVTHDYQIPAANRQSFQSLMPELRRRRLQNGATRWSLDNIPSDNGHHTFRENLFFRSWPERLRHHERTTQADLALEQEVIALHEGAPPTAFHEPYTPIPGIDGHPRPYDQVIGDFFDTVICKMQREFVVGTERMARLHEREKRAARHPV